MDSTLLSPATWFRESSSKTPSSCTSLVAAAPPPPPAPQKNPDDLVPYVLYTRAVVESLVKKMSRAHSMPLSRNLQTPKVATWCGVGV